MSWGAIGATVVGGLVGGGGGGGGGQQQQATTYQPTAQQTDLYQKAQTFSDAGAPDVSGGANLFQQASQSSQNLAGQLPGLIAPAQGASNFALTDAINPGSNPALQEYIKLANNQLTQQYQQQVAPALRNQAVAAGNVGSSRAGIAEGLARQGLVDAQGRQTAAMSSQGYGQGLNAMMQALGMAPQTIGLSGLETSALTDAGNLSNRAATNQYDQDAGALQLYSDLVSGGQGASTSTSSVPQASPWQTALGGAGVGLSIYDAYSKSNPSQPSGSAGSAGAAGYDWGTPAQDLSKYGL